MRLSKYHVLCSIYCFLSKGVCAVGCFDGRYCGATGLTAALISAKMLWYLCKNNNSSKGSRGDSSLSLAFYRIRDLDQPRLESALIALPTASLVSCSSCGNRHVHLKFAHARGANNNSA